MTGIAGCHSVVMVARNQACTAENSRRRVARSSAPHPQTMVEANGVQSMAPASKILAAPAAALDNGTTLARANLRRDLHRGHRRGGDAARDRALDHSIPFVFLDPSHPGKRQHEYRSRRRTPRRCRGPLPNCHRRRPPRSQTAGKFRWRNQYCRCAWRQRTREQGENRARAQPHDATAGAIGEGHRSPRIYSRRQRQGQLCAGVPRAPRRTAATMSSAGPSELGPRPQLDQRWRGRSRR
jgi:hypothetical protein